MNTKDGVLVNVIEVALSLCQQAQKELACNRRGRPTVIPDWFIAVMIAVAVAKGKISKASQLRFWDKHRWLLEDVLEGWEFPSKSTYYQRYRRCWKLFERAIEIHTRKAIGYRWIDPEVASVDKSVIPARGKRPRKSRSRKRQCRVDGEATWTWSEYHGWVYGYSFEVVLTSKKSTVNWPMMASADTASRSETRTLAEKIPRLPSAVKYLLADRGYDADDHCEELEWDGEMAARLAHPACALPEAAWQGRLAWRQFHQRDAPSLALIEPIYVRAPDAVPNLPKPPVLIDG